MKKSLIDNINNKSNTSLKATIVGAVSAPFAINILNKVDSNLFSNFKINSTNILPIATITIGSIIIVCEVVSVINKKNK